VSRHGIGSSFARCDIDRVTLGIQVIHFRSSFCLDVRRTRARQSDFDHRRPCRG
jgi:hypothetical protein